MSFLERNALCPYFQYDKVKDGVYLICCEIGNISLNSKEYKKAVGYRLCADNYNQCQFKEILDAMYDKKES